MFQKKNIADIKFEGTNEEFVWRSPITDFETGSKLTVYESQEALFYFNGACVGVLGPGSHILETEHIPFLKKLIQRITGNESIFHAQVYFVNKVVLDIKWGAGDIVYQDPAGPVFNIGCFGQMNLAAEEPRCIVERLVGSEVSLKRSEVEMKFRQLLASQVRDHLVNAMLDNQISIIQLSARLGRIAELLAPDVAQLFGEYGFSLKNFCISGVNIPEDDPEYQRLKRLRANQGLRMSELQLKQQEELMMAQLAAEKTRIEAQAAAFKRQTEGYDYATEKQFEFLNQILTGKPEAGGRDQQRDAADGSRTWDARRGRRHDAEHDVAVYERNGSDDRHSAADGRSDDGRDAKRSRTDDGRDAGRSGSDDGRDAKRSRTDGGHAGWKRHSTTTDGDECGTCAGSRSGGGARQAETPAGCRTD